MTPQLNTKIRLYLKENGKVYEDEFRNYTLEDNGSGVQLISWNVSGLAQPTDEQLNSYNDAAIIFENNAVIKATRKKSYGDIGDQLDEIYKDIDAWKARIKKIKDDNPKG